MKTVFCVQEVAQLVGCLPSVPSSVFADVGKHEVQGHLPQILSKFEANLGYQTLSQQ